jgi:hypothetical protein
MQTSPQLRYGCIGLHPLYATDDSKNDYSEEDKTYRGKTKIAQRADACVRIIEEVGRFDVSMDYSSRMNVAQCAEKTTKVAFDAFRM